MDMIQILTKVPKIIRFIALLYAAVQCTVLNNSTAMLWTNVGNDISNGQINPGIKSIASTVWMLLLTKENKCIQKIDWVKISPN